jgi:hypothetical protein
VIITIDGATASIYIFKFGLFKNFCAKKLLFKDIIKEMINATKVEVYSVDINSTFVECRSFNVFFLEIRQLRAVGIPVVVRASAIITKLNII